MAAAVAGATNLRGNRAPMSEGGSDPALAVFRGRAYDGPMETLRVGRASAYQLLVAPIRVGLGLALLVAAVRLGADQIGRAHV